MTAEPRTIPPFAGFFERWLQPAREARMRAENRGALSRLSQYFIELLGDTPLDPARKLALELQATVNQLSDRGGMATEEYPKGRPLAPKTVRHIAFLVQDCKQQAADWEIIATNPMLKVNNTQVTAAKKAGRCWITADSTNC